MLNRYGSACIAVLLALSPAMALAEEFKLDDGTPVQLKLLDSLSSGKNVEGNPASFEVRDNILATDGKTVLIKAGAPAWGSITHTQERGMIGQKGSIAVSLDSVKTVDSQRVPLRGHISREGQAKQGTVIALSLLISPLFLLMKGKDGTIPAGTLLTAYIDREMQVHISAPSSTDPASHPDTETALPEYLRKYADKASSLPASPTGNPKP